MTLKNFNASEIKTSKKVKEFYRLTAENKTYPTTWADTIADFDQRENQRIQKIVDMKRIHGNKKCDKCGQLCHVKETQSNVNNNKGKWYWICPDRMNENGNEHLFQWIVY